MGTENRFRSALVRIGTAALASAVAASCSEVGDVSDARGGTDASRADGTDLGAEASASGDAAPVVCGAGSADGSDWAGWHRLAGLDSCCIVDVPDDPTSTMLPLDWVPCTNGLAACSELDATWPLDPLSPYRFGNIKVTVDSQGKPKLLFFTRNLGTPWTAFEDDLYDVSSGLALEAWRQNDVPIGSSVCELDAYLAETAIVLFERGTNGVAIASGDPYSMATAPALDKVGAFVDLAQQEVGATDTLLAWDVEPQGRIVQANLPPASYVATPTTGGTIQLLLELVSNQDVFASSEHGTAGYGQIYEVHPDSTYSLFRSNPSAHVSAMRTDGKTLFWSETYGSTDINGSQQAVEVWAAPYTNDATTLAATAKKIATLPTSTPYVPEEAVAFNGLYVTRPGGTDAIITRLSDGKTLTVSAGTNRYFWAFAFVSSTELWSTVTEGNEHGSALVRIALPAW